jgi:hypothetical protein
MPEPPVRARAEEYEAWCDEIRPVFERVATTRRSWTSFEIADEYDLPDPPNPKSHWGSFVHSLAADGLIEHVGYDETTRPGGDGSAVKVWRGTRAARRQVAA